MQEVGDEEAVLIRLLALEPHTWPALASLVHIRRVDAQAHHTSLLVNAEETLGIGARPVLVPIHKPD